MYNTPQVPIYLHRQDSLKLDWAYTLQAFLFLLKLARALMRVRFPNSVDVSCSALFGYYLQILSQDSKEQAIHSPSTVNQLTAIVP